MASKTKIEPKPNPAPFNDEVLRHIAKLLPSISMTRGKRLFATRLLDPFAGTGKGVDYFVDLGYNAIGVELEPEWAMQSPYVEVGNALHLRYRANTFDVVFTSCVYGNRMSDHHDAKEKCKVCKGTGRVEKDYGIAGLDFPKCEKCGGLGRRKYKRHTYKHYLGRDPSPDSSAVLQWGDAYRAFHEEAWAEVVRVLKPKSKSGRKGGRFILNIKDHWRAGKLQPVTDWHVETLKGLGLKLVKRIQVETPGQRHGQNRELREDFEEILVFEKVA